MTAAEREFKHLPVLFSEVMQSLNLRSGTVFVDGTLGGGGHAEGILHRTAPDGVVIGIDQDADALAAAGARLAPYGGRFRPVRANFAEILDVLCEQNIPQVDGVLLDIGVSSYQLDTPERGFSYMSDGALDMRMDRRNGATAADLLAKLSAEELADIIYKYGEEKFSHRIAQRIVAAREQQPITGTLQLAEIVAGAIPSKARRVEKQHPAKRTFQALRIAVNDELGVLERGLAAAFTALKPGGRLAVITFHSLEDRIVKTYFAERCQGCICPPEFPVCVCNRQPEGKLLQRKPITAGEAELAVNPRARSAKLRVIEKL
ncbi:MAG TPA: 16S rRNA (cytosine(1402)-N(4))-methyltransferase RsmH [Candidatus Avidehalobacter gallistercoris]|uniref:Ribosomal RNA small subunit methyltransferase H n=1 Tax=Candidatus Avidehalobacter gallistercoris TaxID=2840694 RepID=A0A9D1KX31_9FIRM|nr:16S rRNA (cytosine(1402)-N(4))-methyltransferase RsmH [Candidatus Avidehalobacter gallistercoris]